MIAQLHQIFLDSAGVCTDSRRVTTNSIFFALRGDKFDGNVYARQAILDGARLAVVDDPILANDPHCLFVDNVLQTLQDLARYHRKFMGIPVLGITGSNGKTTTKELVSRVLSQKFKVLTTQGNLNNHIGVPLTLLSIKPEHQFAVVEMGANHQGEIDLLCRIALPNYGIITNIGKAHLEGFGGVEGVKKGKSEMYRYLNEVDGTVFVDLDQQFLESLAANLKHQYHYTTSDSPAAQRADLTIGLLPNDAGTFLSFELAGQTAQTQLTGLYNFNNVKTAAAVGTYFEVPNSDIVAAIASYCPDNNRSQLMPYQSAQMILDAYNANPTSMAFALDNLMVQAASPRVAIIGDMLELGEESLTEHQAIIQKCLASNIDTLVFVGPEFERAKQSGRGLYFKSAAEAKTWFLAQDFGQGVILLKASRGIGLEQLLK
jgi:UDP-N-acetylmuramoyl-tripeptide--D-alanyl-D-alanine ligase